MAKKVKKYESGGSVTGDDYIEVGDDSIGRSTHAYPSSLDERYSENQLRAKEDFDAKLEEQQRIGPLPPRNIHNRVLKVTTTPYKKGGSVTKAPWRKW